MKKESSRSMAENGTHSPAAQFPKWQIWFAFLALILGILVGNSVTRQNVPALIVFAAAIAAVYVLVQKGYASSVLVYSVMLVLLIAFTNPRLLAFFSTAGPSGSLWSTFGALAGLGLLATSLGAARRPGGVVSAVKTPPEVLPRRAVTSVDLLLTTVSKIPTFVKRLSPLPKRRSPQNGAGTLHSAEYVCRVLPTPPQPDQAPRLHRWPGDFDRRRM